MWEKEIEVIHILGNKMGVYFRYKANILYYKVDFFQKRTGYVLKPKVKSTTPTLFPKVCNNIFEQNSKWL